ncbi:hypothetical protein J6590_086872 [Homalodisca vitripennis]|nr:hypothetical protein J6590_086872 [Homalodisca vitripennis]
MNVHGIVESTSPFVMSQCRYRILKRNKRMKGQSSDIPKRFPAILYSVERYNESFTLTPAISSSSSYIIMHSGRERNIWPPGVKWYSAFTCIVYVDKDTSEYVVVREEREEKRFTCIVYVDKDTSEYVVVSEEGEAKQSVTISRLDINKDTSEYVVVSEEREAKHFTCIVYVDKDTSEYVVVSEEREAKHFTCIVYVDKDTSEYLVVSEEREAKHFTCIVYVDKDTSEYVVVSEEREAKHFTCIVYVDKDTSEYVVVSEEREAKQSVTISRLDINNRMKHRRAWLLLEWVTAERSCPCKQPACQTIGGGSEVTFKPLVPRLSVREGFLALTSPGKTRDSLLFFITMESCDIF